MHRALLVVTLSCCTLAFSDQIYLQNGDRVSGSVQEISGEAILLDTPYAGPLTILREAVSGIATEAAMAVQLEDGGTVVGRFVWGETGQQILDNQGLGPMPLETVTSAVLHAAVPEGEPAPVAEEAAQEGPAEEAPPEEEAPSPWSGVLESGLTLTRGNTDTTDFTLSVKATRKSDRHELTLKGSASYGEADGTLNKRRMSGEARWQYYTNERSFLYLLGGAERDDGRKLDLRLNAALGLGYDFIENEKRTFAADAGFEYAWERWAPYTPWGRDTERESVRRTAYTGVIAALGSISASGITLDNLEQLAGHLVDLRYPLRGAETLKEEDLSLRLGAVYTQKIFKESTLSETLTLYPNLDEWGEFRGVSELALATPLTEALKLSISLRSEYDSMADDQDVDPWDNTLVTGLRYEF